MTTELSFPQSNMRFKTTAKFKNTVLIAPRSSFGEAQVNRAEPFRTMPNRLPPSTAGRIFEIECNRKSSDPSLNRIFSS